MQGEEHIAAAVERQQLIARQAFGHLHSPGILRGAGLQPVPFGAEALGLKGFDQQGHVRRERVVVAIPPEGGRQVGAAPLPASRECSRSKNLGQQ